jgi:hypothetical protein
MAKPLVFISHKHSDRRIATVIRSLITEQTVGKIDVFQSSDPAAQTPSVGRNLNVELCNALWKAAAIILVYTTPEEDWSYCMWECGVATLPNSPDTRIILFQCGESVPPVFEGQLGVNARDKGSVQGFVKQFMTDARFLPNQSEALTGYHAADSAVERAATKFFDDLQEVLPEGPAVKWPAHPYVRLELSNKAVRAICDNSGDDQQQLRQIVLANTTVGGSDRFAPLLGIEQLEDRVSLQRVYDLWRESHLDDSSEWVNSLTKQLHDAASRKPSRLQWSAMPVMGGDRIPIVTRVRKIPSQGSLQFDVYFYPFDLLDAAVDQSRIADCDSEDLQQGSIYLCALGDVIGSLVTDHIAPMVERFKRHKRNRRSTLEVRDRSPIHLLMARLGKRLPLGSVWFGITLLNQPKTWTDPLHDQFASFKQTLSERAATQELCVLRLYYFDSEAALDSMRPQLEADKASGIITRHLSGASRQPPDISLLWRPKENGKRLILPENTTNPVRAIREQNYRPVCALVYDTLGGVTLTRVRLIPGESDEFDEWAERFTESWRIAKDF